MQASGFVPSAIQFAPQSGLQAPAYQSGIQFAPQSGLQAPAYQSGIQFAPQSGLQAPAYQSGIQFAPQSGLQAPAYQSGIQFAPQSGLQAPAYQSGIQFAPQSGLQAPGFPPLSTEPSSGEELAVDIAAPIVSPTSPPDLRLTIPPETANPNAPQAEITFDQWLHPQYRGSRKVVLANRYFYLTQITTFLISVLRRPYFLVSDHLQHIAGARSAFIPGTVDPTQASHPGLSSTNFDLRYVDPNAVIIYEGNHTDLARLEGWTGDVIFIVGFGIDRARANMLRQSSSADDIIRAMYPRSWELKIEVDQVLMSEYQREQYRIMRSKEIASGKAAKEAMSGKVVSPTRYGRYGKQTRSPEKQAGYESEIMLRSKQRGNFVYPGPMQDEYNKDDKRFRNKSILKPDRPEAEGGWIAAEHIQNLGIFSPKLLRLVTRVLARSAGSQTFVGKFVISTSFKEHHGMELISTVLRYYGVPNYQLHGQLATTDELKRAKKQQIVQNFNAAESGVLIVTNQLTFDFNLFNVDELIIFDGAQPGPIYALLGTIFHDTHFTKPKIVRLVFLISRLTEKLGSVDAVYYKKFETEEETRQTAYRTIEDGARVLANVNQTWSICRLPNTNAPVATPSLISAQAPAMLP